MTYNELSEFGLLRKKHRLGPYHTYLHLLSIEPWKSMRPTQVAEKVKKFYFYYAINRHSKYTLATTETMESLTAFCRDHSFNTKVGRFNRNIWQLGLTSTQHPSFAI